MNIKTCDLPSLQHLIAVGNSREVIEGKVEWKSRFKLCFPFYRTAGNSIINWHTGEQIKRA